MNTATTVATGIDVLLNLIDRLSVAGSVVKQAHAEGRDVSAAELAGLRSQLDGHIADLDAAIAQAKAEGR